MTAPDSHEGFTKMLFVDAIVGVGFPHLRVVEYAVRDGLAKAGDGVFYRAHTWDRVALERLSLPTLQELYTSLKLHEVTHGG